MEVVCYDVIVVGGGAAGMAAALTYKNLQPNGKVAVFDVNERICEKVAIAGNGRCNIGNLKGEYLEDAKDFWNLVSIATASDEKGWLYPISEEGRAVQKAIENMAAQLEIEVFTKTRISGITRNQFDENGFKVITENGETFTAHKVLIACGGKACPRLGTKGDGYGFARNFGHKVERVRPVLVPVTVKENLNEKDLGGIRTKADVRLFSEGKEVFRELGQVQFLDDCISGIVIFNLSRHLVIPEGQGLDGGFDTYRIVLDLCPQMELSELTKHITIGLEKGKCIKDTLTTVVKSKLAELFEREVLEGQILNDATEIAKGIKAFTLHVSGTKGWKDAQASGGGVALRELNKETMESSLVCGLYFAGEVLDYDGPCGGYNLQHCWHTGVLSGRGMASE